MTNTDDFASSAVDTEVWADEGGATTDGPATRVPAQRSVDHDRQAHPGQGTSAHELVDITQTAWAVSAEATDVRGFHVLDRHGEDVGTVDHLLIDATSHHVRLLAVGSGGFLGLGRSSRLVPVEAVTALDHSEATITIDTTRQAVDETPVYDPTLEPLPSGWDSYRDPYGLSPLGGTSTPYLFLGR